MMMDIFNPNYVYVFPNVFPRLVVVLPVRAGGQGGLTCRIHDALCVGIVLYLPI